MHGLGSGSGNIDPTIPADAVVALKPSVPTGDGKVAKMNKVQDGPFGRMFAQFE